MSVWEAGRVWEESPHKGATLLVLLAAAFQTDDDGVCYLKVKDLMRKGRISKRAVKYALSKLDTSGELRATTDPSGPGIALRYQLGMQYLHPSRAKGVQPVPSRSAKSAKRGAMVAAPLFRENKTYESKPMGADSLVTEPKPPAADRGQVCRFCDNTGIFEAQDGRLKGFCDCPAGQELARKSAPSPLAATGLTPARRRHARPGNAI